MIRRGEPILVAARRRQINARRDVRPRAGVAAEDAVRVALDRVQREPGLPGSDERTGPAAQDSVGDAAAAHVLLALAERQLELRRDDDAVRHVEDAVAPFRARIVAGG